MSGVEGIVGGGKAIWNERDEGSVIPTRVTARAPIGRAPTVSAPWTHDGSTVPDAVRNYDPAMFGNPALRSAPLETARLPAVAPAPDPLPPAADACKGIRLACLAENLPSMTRTDRASAVRVGGYTLHPAVRVHDDGSRSLLYWTAVNREMKRAEFIVGPESLETFKRGVDSFENAAATAYMHGEPNEWQRLSMKAVDDAMRGGPFAAVRTLKSAWSAAVRDPGWWGQNILAVSTAMAGAGGAGRAEASAAEDSAAVRGPGGPVRVTTGPNTPIAEGGGLRAHEGGAARAHLIERHVGKTTAELEARLGTSKNLPASSSFFDRAQAEAAAVKTLAANDVTVVEWMKRSGQERLSLEYHPIGPAFPVGMLVTRDGEAVAVAGVRLVLVRDATMPTGFRILTGHPIH